MRNTAQPTHTEVSRSFNPTALILRGACAAVLIVAAGCAGNKVHVVTNPAGSQVNVVNTKGKTVASGLAPLDAKVSFSGSNPHYTVQITPPPNLRERYNARTTNLAEFDFQSLPVFRNEKHRLMDVKLDEKLFVVVPYIEVVLDAQRTWRGVVMRSRAYKDISEVGGAVPTQVADLNEDGGIQSLALSPDGNRIVYSMAKFSLSPGELTNRYAQADPPPIDLAGADLKGISILTRGVEAITSESFRDMFPSFTADGEYLLFASNRRRADSEDILRISALHRSGVSDIYVHRDARLMHPTQAKDGTIAYCVEEPNPQDPKKRFSLWTLGGPNQFPTQIQTGSQPTISPDGKRIAYIGADDNLWVVNTDGSQATQLTFGADKILERYKANLEPAELAYYNSFFARYGFPEKRPFSYPSWSADGLKIVYAGMEGSDSTGRPNEDIWIMDFDGSNKRQLTTNGSIDRYPLLSPDGKWVYFMSNRGGHWAIWRIPTPEK